MNAVVWVILAAILGVAEIFTLTAALGLLAVAALAAAGVAALGVGALVGRQARVVQEVTGHAGRVRIGGEEWSARSYDETLVIPAGSTVDVIEIEGATALVYPRE
jgi:membrane protein implicated in regulation of membrane protease activity